MTFHFHKGLISIFKFFFSFCTFGKPGLEPQGSISAFCRWCGSVGSFRPWPSIHGWVWSSRDDSAPPHLRPWFWTSGSGWVSASAGGASASLDLVLSDGELEPEMDRRIGASSAVMRALLLHIERSQLRWFLWLGCLLGGGPGQNQNSLEGLYMVWEHPRRSCRVWVSLLNLLPLLLNLRLVEEGRMDDVSTP